MAPNEKDSASGSLVSSQMPGDCRVAPQATVHPNTRSSPKISAICISGSPFWKVTSTPSAKADIVLDHALTAIRVKLVLGDFTGDASVSEIAVASPGLASTATLNAADGSLDNIAGQGDKFTLPVDFGLVAGGTDNDVMFVSDASVESGVTTVSANIGGKKYTAGIEFDEAYKQGYIYTYTLTLNNSGFSVTKVNVNPWETGTDDSAVLQPEKDDTYVVKIVASYSAPGPASLLDDEVMAYNNSQTISSRSANTFYFEHNMVGFVGTIDWGDGTTDTYDESVDLPYHFYVNDGQEYTITAKGVINELSSNAQQFKHCLKELIKIGKDCKIESMEFAFTKCSNLTEIKPGALDGCEKVTNFGATFYGCSNLQTVPVGLFDKCTKVTTFISDESENIGDGIQYYSCFGLCYSLNEIPEGLFDNCTEVTDFGKVFRRCVNLRNIPEGLFDNNTKVTNFGGTFEGCENLTSIPEGLFDYNTKVTDFSYAFARSYFGGDMRITTIPEGLFDNCPVVTNFFGVFYGCSSLTGESPYTIINVDGEDVKVHLYERANYPEYFTEPEWIYSCFNGCEGLTDYSTIPSDWK